jgi:hypothetical protein
MLRRHRCGPVSDHQLIGLPAEQQRTIAARILLDKRIPFRIVLACLCPVHAAVRVHKVSIQRNVIEND